MTEPTLRNALHVASGAGAFRLSILDAVSDAVWWASYSRPAHDPWWVGMENGIATMAWDHSRHEP